MSSVSAKRLRKAHKKRHKTVVVSSSSITPNLMPQPPDAIAYGLNGDTHSLQHNPCIVARHLTPLIHFLESQMKNVLPRPEKEVSVPDYTYTPRDCNHTSDSTATDFPILFGRTFVNHSSSTVSMGKLSRTSSAHKVIRLILKRS